MLVRKIIKIEVDVPHLGDTIKAVQLESGLTVAQTVRELGISRTYWDRIVGQPEMAISVELLRRIEELFDVDFGVEI